jgi:Rod binding domain-containing protein
MNYDQLASAPIANFKPSKPPLPAATPAQFAKIHQTAKAFEAQLVSQMLQPMFDGLSTDGEFDGGQAEGTYRNFLVDAIGKQMERSGGIGVARSVEREMLKMQGLSEPVAATASLAAPAASAALLRRAYGAPSAPTSAAGA